MQLNQFARRHSSHAAASVFTIAATLALLSCKPSSKPADSSAEPSAAASQPAISQPAAQQIPPNPSGKLQPINVVVITLDTVRADHLHCYGNQKIKTPVIDGLAQKGTLFEMTVAQAPMTDPSHASIFTGTNPNVHSVRDTGGFPLPASSITLATILHKSGWETGAFISASVLEKWFGLNQGFTTYDDQMPIAKNDTGGFHREASRPANITVDHAIDWLDKRSKKPYFLWVHLYDAHEPYNPPPEFRRQYPNNLYDAEIAFTDQQVGRLLEVVRKKSSGNNTLVVLLSDHGEGLGDHGEYAHGVFLYDSTLRIPWIMIGPGVPAGLRIQQQAREIDVLPTVLNLLGGTASSVVQGTSMVPTFTSKQVPTTYSYEETLYPKINMGWSELRGIHTAHWMYVRAPRPELYNLDTDPGELNNIIDAHPKEYRELEEQLKRVSSSTETVVANPMDQQTLAKLQSLGYVGSPSEQGVHADGRGADPKDRIAVLKIQQVILGPAADKLPPAQKIEMLRQALSQDPTDPALYYELGLIYEQTRQWDLALQTYLTAYNQGIQPNMILSRIGKIYLSAGQKPQAIMYFERAVQLYPLDAKCQTNLGTAYMQSGRTADADRAFRRALVSEQFPPAYNGLAILAMQAKDYANARKYFEHAIQLNPEYAEALFNLGLICKQTNDIPCAKKAFRTFLIDNPKGAFPAAETRAQAELHSMH